VILNRNVLTDGVSVVFFEFFLKLILLFVELSGDVGVSFSSVSDDEKFF